MRDVKDSLSTSRFIPAGGGIESTNCNNKRSDKSSAIARTTRICPLMLCDKLDTPSSSMCLVKLSTMRLRKCRAPNRDAPSWVTTGSDLEVLNGLSTLLPMTLSMRITQSCNLIESILSPSSVAAVDRLDWVLVLLSCGLVINRLCSVSNSSSRRAIKLRLDELTNE
jgi:hypothetical protein